MQKRGWTSRSENPAHRRTDPPETKPGDLPDKETKMTTLRPTHTLTLVAALCGVALLALIGGAAQAEVKLSGLGRYCFAPCDPGKDPACTVLRFDDSGNLARPSRRLLSYGPEAGFLMKGLGSIVATQAAFLPYPLGAEE